MNEQHEPWKTNEREQWLNILNGLQPRVIVLVIFIAIVLCLFGCQFGIMIGMRIGG